MKIRYKIEMNCDEKRLDELGQDGWDLVSVIWDGDEFHSKIFYFKQILNYN